MTRQALLLFAAMLAVASAACASTCGPNGCYVTPRPPSPPVAAPSHAAPSQAAIGRIVHREAGGSSLGSGTLVAASRDASHFLTCAHLFASPGRTEVRIGRTTLRAKVVALDRAHDLALLRAEPFDGAPADWSAQQPSGELTACGYGSSGAMRCVRGPIVGYATATGASAPSLRLRGAVRSGDSGGPVFDRGGRLVAVVWGQRGGETYAMGGGPLRAILAKLPRALDPVRRRQLDSSQGGVPSEADRRWREQVDRRLDALARQPAARPTTPPPALPDDLVRRGDLQGIASRWEERFDHLDRRLAGAGRAPTDRSPTLGGTLRRWMPREPLLTAIGVGGPLAAGLLAGRMLWTWSRRRKEQRTTLASGETAPAPPPRAVAVDSPPPPQRVVPETHYVSYERDDYARAHQWASEQLARKFPGAVELLTSLDSLIRQHLAGEKEP